MRKESDRLLTTQNTMKKNSKKEQKTMMEGMMVIGKTNDGLHTADFISGELVEIETLIGTFKVHIMHDGNIYMQEQPKKKRNHPMFREDNMSLSHGTDTYWYVSFRCADEDLVHLPEMLTKQAAGIARKVKLMLKNER